MKTKSPFSRSVLKGTAAALVIAAGAAGATFAVAQQGASAGVVVGGVTYTVDSVNSVEELKAALKTATNKADVVKLLNLAAQAGLTKDSVLLAIQDAKAETTGATSTVLASVEKAVTSSKATGGSVLSFYEGTDPNTSTGSTGSNTGNNAASGSKVETASNDGTPGSTTTTTTTTTTSVYVG